MDEKQKPKAASKKSDVVKMSDEEAVAAYMNQLSHPLKEEIEALRSIIKNGNKEIAERIKWNAPSYYAYGQDMVTFNPRDAKRVHLVFHHAAIATIQSPLLEGDYKDRRMTYFKDMTELKANKKELKRIINELVTAIKKSLQ